MARFSLAGAGMATVLLALTACGRHAPSPSHVAAPYRGQLTDDTLWEASTTVLVTRRDVVIALDCAPLKDALARQDDGPIDRAVQAGNAARLPAGVTIYTPPFSERNAQSAPLVVTDDRHAGTLCTPDSFDVVKT
ncbi:MAG TPA: hypothetical protein VKR05_00035 [Candidatus Cybelea sp.]|nr:hypothetical protein [Candidatus Cybelea sp.]